MREILKKGGKEREKEKENEREWCHGIMKHSWAIFLCSLYERIYAIFIVTEEGLKISLSKQIITVR